MITVFLCGFMGSGKTSVGKELASMLGTEFYDLDVIIEERAGMAIPEIFDKRGEAAFRGIESACLSDLCLRDGVVAALGGGALGSVDNRKLIKNAGYVVFLDIPFALAWQRIHKSDRPLVNRLGRKSLEMLFNERRPVYLATADYVADGRGNPATVAKSIAGKLSDNQ